MCGPAYTGWYKRSFTHGRCVDAQERIASARGLGSCGVKRVGVRLMDSVPKIERPDKSLSERPGAVGSLSACGGTVLYEVQGGLVEARVVGGTRAGGRSVQWKRGPIKDFSQGARRRLLKKQARFRDCRGFFVTLTYADGEDVSQGGRAPGKRDLENLWKQATEDR